MEKTDLAEWERIGAQLQKAAPSQPAPVELQGLWEAVLQAWHEPIFTRSRADIPEHWWRAALALMVISDCASHHIGWHSPNPSWLQDFFSSNFYNVKQEGEFIHPPSIAIMADPDVVCVQPKSRTPNVGLGLRTLTHNLCLLPPRGEVSTAWMCPPSPPFRLTQESSGALNILLLPFPYEIQDDAWKTPREGWFELKQGWLEKSDGGSKSDIIVKFVAAAVLQAKQQLQKGVTIHGIVFPEYALNSEIFGDLLAEIVRDAQGWAKTDPDRRNDNTEHDFPLHDIEFVVAGSSDYRHHAGNFVLQALRLKHEDERVIFNVNGRSKHHRWIIDGPQIQTYALQHVLTDRGRWAETIRVYPREIQTFVLRQGSSFTSMICEDLARSDPCLDVLRDLGPNIVFVLLMDGPQTPTRWSARYAQALSDDPGCAVLNVTSLALVERTNGTGIYPRSRSIALFRGTNGRTHEIICPEGCHGAVVSLRGEAGSETTLDGRLSKDSIDWRFERYVPVRVFDPAIRNDLFKR